MLALRNIGASGVWWACANLIASITRLLGLLLLRRVGAGGGPHENSAPIMHPIHIQRNLHPMLEHWRQSLRVRTSSAPSMRVDRPHLLSQQFLVCFWARCGTHLCPLFFTAIQGAMAALCFGGSSCPPLPPGADCFAFSWVHACLSLGRGPRQGQVRLVTARTAFTETASETGTI